jgi:hypothetical protein
VGRARADRLSSYFNLPRDLREVCTWVAGDCERVKRRMAALDSSQAYRIKRLLDAVPGEGLVVLYAMSGTAGRNLIVEYLAGWRTVRARLDGADLVALGVPQGPAVGRMLERIERLMLAGKLETREAEIAYVKRAAARANQC